jgi:hypothetical protein
MSVHDISEEPLPPSPILMIKAGIPSHEPVHIYQFVMTYPSRHGHNHKKLESLILMTL